VEDVDATYKDFSTRFNIVWPSSYSGKRQGPKNLTILKLYKMFYC
jgi:hypothetical protein